jgi:hypothetical protein
MEINLYIFSIPPTEKRSKIAKLAQQRKKKRGYYASHKKHFTQAHNRLDFEKKNPKK